MSMLSKSILIHSWGTPVLWHKDGILVMPEDEAYPVL